MIFLCFDHRRCLSCRIMFVFLQCSHIYPPWQRCRRGRHHYCRLLGFPMAINCQEEAPGNWGLNLLGVLSGVVFGISEFWASVRDLDSEGEEGAMNFLSVGGRAEAAGTKEMMCFSLKLEVRMLVRMEMSCWKSLREVQNQLSCSHCLRFWLCAGWQPCLHCLQVWDSDSPSTGRRLELKGGHSSCKPTCLRVMTISEISMGGEEETSILSHISWFKFRSCFIACRILGCGV